MKAFKKRYAGYYDRLYFDKNYEKEVDFIEEIIKKYATLTVKSILDTGCGTGGHAIPLAKRGYDVSGFDISESMLERAKEKAKNNRLKLDVELADLRTFHLNKQFDAILCMFAVMGYITKNEDLLATLKNIRRHLKKDSLFIFDFWNGLAVLRTLPEVRIKTIENDGEKLMRIVQPEIDSYNHLCKVHYHMLITKQKAIIDEFDETHNVRFFFPQEIVHYLEEAQFDTLRICPFLKLDGKVDENSWNITVIAKAKGNIA